MRSRLNLMDDVRPRMWVAAFTYLARAGEAGGEAGM